jgi:hypothetical protein
MAGEDSKQQPRNFPHDSLDTTLRVARAIHENMGGKPMNRLLVADAIGIRPGSSNFRALLSSSLKYGLTTGTEKAKEIAMTELGRRVLSPDERVRVGALREALLRAPVFGSYYQLVDNSRIPAKGMLAKVLVDRFDVPAKFADECAQLVEENGRFVGIIRDIGGSAHVMLGAGDDPDPHASKSTDEPEEQPVDGRLDSPDSTEAEEHVEVPPADPGVSRNSTPRPIFVGHGKRRPPLEKLESILQRFKIPYKTSISEPNLNRPIPTKVRDILQECGSAILIFTKDEKFFDVEGDEVWRPSENTLHELGAASFLYENRVVIFKEKGIHFPSNVDSVGTIEFEEDAIEARTVELLQELIAFGLVKITPN